MAHAAHPQKSQPPVPAPPPDAENQAIIDAFKTFKWILVGAVFFVGSAVFLIMRTRIG
jgi:hypothetical protein